MVNTEKRIVDEYFIYAADSKSQATISTYKKEYEAYIGVTPEGITEYTVVRKKYIVGKNNKDHFFIIEKGKDNYSLMNYNEFELFLESINVNLDKIKWLIV